jgi:SNF2 family DNA or RNA helicase
MSFLAHLAESRGVWGPFLVISPASTLHNWDRELHTFLPEFKVGSLGLQQPLIRLNPQPTSRIQSAHRLCSHTT